MKSTGKKGGRGYGSNPEDPTDSTRPLINGGAHNGIKTQQTLGTEQDRRIPAKLHDSGLYAYQPQNLMRKDRLWERFHELGLDDLEESLLVPRNKSVLGHGFQPINKEQFDRLAEAVHKLAMAAFEGRG